MGGLAAITAGAVSLGAGLIGGAMIAGGALTGIGALTGNKNLMKWGGVLSLAGGISGLATGAWSSTASTLAQETAQQSAAAYGSVAETAAGAGGMAADTSMLGSWFSASSQTAALNQAQAAAAQTAIQPATVSAIPGMESTFSGPMTAAQAAGAGTSSGGLGSMLSSAAGWAKQNPQLAQIGGQMVAAGMNSYAQQDAIKEQLKQQDASQQRARDRLSASIMPVKMPVYQRGG